jgi:mRNA-degrading endonuclease toxin of MazEF toxin-antitoxin module
MPQRLVLGRIVWAEIADANGFRKLRPGVVVTPTARLTPGAAIDVVAITSRLGNPLPEDHVLLPWHAQGHPRTGLNRRCAAVCSWLGQITESDIRDVAGIVPTSAMATILAKLVEYSSHMPPPKEEESPPQGPPTNPPVKPDS